MKDSWGAIEPAESSTSRLRLDFGLRSAILRFNEWAVPGLGGAFFVRQLSWSCMGLRLAPDIGDKTTAARIAEGLEALAGWIVVRHAHGDKVEEDRIQGKRKFKDLKSLSFDDVSGGGAYVTVPFRRAATRALPGLGFCTEEARFSALTLTQEGAELAELCMADASARAKIVGWLSAESKPLIRIDEPLKKLLLPEHATEAEKTLVRQQVLGDERRSVLATLLDRIQPEQLAEPARRKEFLNGLPDLAMRKRMQTCFAFEDLRTASLAAVQEVSNEINAHRISAKELSQHPDVAQRFETLNDASRELGKLLDNEAPAEAAAFCAEQAVPSLPERILSLCRRVPMIFSVIGEQIDKGVSYTKELVADDPLGNLDSEEVGSSNVPQPLFRLRRLLQETRQGALDAG